jgi:prolyl-tRNA editing enzyme YbaK/EbsC (Cys-tRNA(Pro) deacylase)
VAYDEVTKPLDEAGVPFTIKPHTEVALTAVEAAQERGVRVSQIVKCMVARSEQGDLCAALLPGDRTLKLRKVRKVVGSPLALVDPQELADDMGLTIGAISPFHLVGKARIFMDPTVLEEELVDISSGDLRAGIELPSKALRMVLDAEIFDLISSRS